MSKLLFDRLRVQVRGKPHDDYLRSAIVFYNDDAMRQTLAGQVVVSDLPSLAPPYPLFFIECSMPLFDTIKAMGAVAMPSIGVLFKALNYEDGVAGGWQTPDRLVYGWAYEIALFLENKNTRQIECVGVANMLLDAQGQPIAFAPQGYSHASICHFRWNDQFRAKLPSTQVEADQMTVLPETMMDAALYTIGMLHCRNIGTEVITPRRAESHKLERKFGVKMASYHVLKVTGKGGAAGTLIGAPGTGTPKPLHWVRGHFKSYSADAPLLGKIAGTFYWGATTRGRADRGMVTKDYDVRVDPAALKEQR